MHALSILANTYRRAVPAQAQIQLMELPLPCLISRLNEHPMFTGILNHFMKHTSEWEKYCDLPDPHNQPLPAPYNTELTTFQKLMVLRCLRLDMIVPAVQNYVEGKC